MPLRLRFRRNGDVMLLIHGLDGGRVFRGRHTGRFFKSTGKIIHRGIRKRLGDFRDVPAVLADQLLCAFDFQAGQIDRSIRKVEKDERQGKSPDSVAKVVVKVLKKKRPPLRKTVGFFYKCAVFLPRILSCKFVNFIVRKIYL